MEPERQESTADLTSPLRRKREERPPVWQGVQAEEREAREGLALGLAHPLQKALSPAPLRMTAWTTSLLSHLSGIAGRRSERRHGKGVTAASEGAPCMLRERDLFCVAAPPSLPHFWRSWLRSWTIGPFRAFRAWGRLRTAARRLEPTVSAMTGAAAFIARVSGGQRGEKIREAVLREE